MTDIILTLAALVLSFIFGLITIPLIISFCRKHKLFDYPGERKIHRNSIPRLGGICFFPSAFIATTGVMTWLAFNGEGMEKQLTINLWTLGFITSLVLVYVLGVIDDIIGLKARLKFIVQIIAACIFPLCGLYVDNLYGLLGINEIPLVIAYPLTVFIVVFVCNAINLIDGIDGLSSGLSTIALCGYFVLFFNESILTYSLIISAMIGVLLAFMRFNLFGSESKGHKIFMGDSGSLSLGFVLAFLLLKTIAVHPDGDIHAERDVIIGYTMLVVPLFDVIRVSFVRMMHKRPVFDADKNHIHHKLLRTGMSAHWALVTIITFALAIIFLNVVLMDFTNINIIVLSDIILWILFNNVINFAVRRNGLTPYEIPKKN